MTTHPPGTLVRARGREWIVLTGSDADVLHVRPVSGSEDDHTLIHVGLEPEPVASATFPPPVPTQRASHEAAQLLRDALLLSLRRGAGPFRCFGQIAVRPRGYQLVPLMMALKLEPAVRLLIADDVGIGKTIEAALIAREMLDRGDIDRSVVLCPPHLVDQWVSELEGHFHLRAVPVTAASAARLERGLPQSESIFTAHAHTVVSLDYIKNDRRRAEFLRTCPDLVIVDEAHTCAATGPGRHQRFELLRAVAESPTRHLVMLTATPHSGDEAAFYRLLALLHPDFARLAEAEGNEREKLRERLSRHFVQRRRPDIEAWKDDTTFPRRETIELTYTLTGEHEAFFDAVLDYCRGVVQAAGGDERRERLNFWGTLALMRCVASSPAAALSALRTRAGLDAEVDEDALAANVFDGAADALPDDDQEPAAQSDDPALDALISQAARLAESADPKLKLLTTHVERLLDDGFSPVVFCRYIATADHVAAHLRSKLRGTTVAAVTGELTAEVRKERVATLGAADRRVLVATDCLSEGINLQQHFDAVVHYDLSWNPTRHEQREGRVDRFGQPQRVVRASLIYGANNPVDGAVLQVILRKAAKIKEELGVPVPLPAEGQALTQVLLRAVLLSRRYGGDTSTAQQLELFWNDAAEKAKRNRTIFAQRRLKPEDVLPEWEKSLAALGDREEVQRFTGRALAYLGSGLEPLRHAFKAPLAPLPPDVRERLEAEGLTGTLRLDFRYPAAPGCVPVQRSHPLVAVLAETLLERSLGNEIDAGALGRAGCWITDAVQVRTTVALLRLRHQLQTRRAHKTTTLIVEEATALAWSGAAARTLSTPEALALLSAPPADEPPVAVRDRQIAQALDLLAARSDELAAFARARAEALLADHDRVREASAARGASAVTALLPADVIGLYVLLPRVD